MDSDSHNTANQFIDNSFQLSNLLLTDNEAGSFIYNFFFHSFLFINSIQFKCCFLLRYPITFIGIKWQICRWNKRKSCIPNTIFHSHTFHTFTLMSMLCISISSSLTFYLLSSNHIHLIAVSVTSFNIQTPLIKTMLAFFSIY